MLIGQKEGTLTAEKVRYELAKKHRKLDFIL